MRTLKARMAQVVSSPCPLRHRDTLASAAFLAAYALVKERFPRNDGYGSETIKSDELAVVAHARTHCLDRQ